MTAENPNAPDDVDAINFAAIVRLIWQYRRLVGALTFAFTLIALVLALLTTPYFRAEAVLTYVHDKGMGEKEGSLDDALAGMASLAGMNLLSGGTDDQEALAVLDSRHLAEEFIQRNDLIPVLLKNSKKTPTMWRAVKQFKDGVVVIHKDPRKGTTTVAVVWKDAKLAAQWANAYVALVNDVIRRRAMDEASQNIVYLNEQIAKTNDVDLRRILYNIIESEQKTLMLASGRDEYAFQVVDPAVPPEIKAGPHRSLIVLAGLVLGFCLGGGIAFVRDRLARHRQARAEPANGLVPAAQG